MLFRTISSFETNFKLLDRLNTLVFNVWRDKSAQIYKDSDMARITNEYRNYISQVRTLSEEVKRIENSLGVKLNEITHIKNDIMNLYYDLPINKCAIWSAYGENLTQDQDGYVTSKRCAETRFVAKYNTERDAAAHYLGPCDKIYVSLDTRL